MGSYLSLFLFYFSDRKSFLISKYYVKSAFLRPHIFLFPVAGATEMLPYGVPFESLSFLYSPPTHFFDFKFLMENRPFFAKNTNLLALTNLTYNRYSIPSGSSTDLHKEARSAVLTDGWMDGWDGWDWMEYQKCPSKFFILCGYIEHVYT